MKTKKCTKCKLNKKESDFYLVKWKTIGQCKECHKRQVNRIYREKTYIEVENLEGEVWVDIPSLVGLYQVSNFSRIKYLDKKWNCGDKIKKQFVSPYGYVVVQITKNNITRQRFVHRLVAESFIPNPENKPTVNHKNGVKTDNRIENLEWCTQRENNIHALKIGLKSNSGENHPMTKLKNDDILYIRNSKLEVMELSVKFNLSKQQIKKIKNKKAWTNIP